MEDIKYRRIIQAATELPWAILQQKMLAICDLLLVRASGTVYSPEQIKQLINASHREIGDQAPPGAKFSNIAVLPLIGTIVPRGNMFEESSGAVSIQRFQNNFRKALKDPAIDGILLDIDSPGGQVGAVAEMSTEIFKARGQKPIKAIANNLAASAAYWIGSAADELFVSPTGEVGSIGVFALHEDFSRLLQNEGITVSVISAGKYKTEANPFQSLTKDARQAMQARVDEYYDMFVEHVARNRQVGVDVVKNGFGEGRVVGAQDAKSMRMVDVIGTFDDAALSASSAARSGSVYAVLKPKAMEEITVTATAMPEFNTEGKDIMTKQAVQEMVKLPNGDEISLDQVAQMYQELEAIRQKQEETRAQLQEARIREVANEATDRVVSPVVVGIATQLMSQLHMDAAPSLTIDRGEGDEEPVQVNMFAAIAELLAVIPGRGGEITYTKDSEPLPQERITGNRYVDKTPDGTTTDEIEAMMVQRRRELGLNRNGDVNSLEISG